MSDIYKVKDTKEYMNRNNWERKKGMSAFAKSILIILAIGVVIFVGYFSAHIFNQIQENKKYNFGLYEMVLEANSSEISLKTNHFEFTKLQINQKLNLKGSIKLHVQNVQEFEEDGITPKVQGVYMRVKFFGEVYDMGEDGESTLNASCQETIDNVFANYLYTTEPSKWFKDGEYYYFNGTSYAKNKMCLRNQEKVELNSFYVQFPQGVIDGTWYEKSIKISAQVEIVDFESETAIAWKDLKSK